MSRVFCLLQIRVAAILANTDPSAAATATTKTRPTPALSPTTRHVTRDPTSAPTPDTEATADRIATVMAAEEGVAGMAEVTVEAVTEV